MLASKPLFPRWTRGLATLAAAAALVGCGGSDDDTDAPSAPTLSGTAAVGAPIVGGTVTVQCAGGSTLSTTTGSAGTWQVTTSGQTLPCAVQVTNGTVGGAANTTPYHSLALSFDVNVNVTPLTDIVVANLVQGDPQAWFAAPSFGGIDAAAVGAAIDRVKTALGLGTALSGLDPLTAEFQAVPGDTLDDILEAFAATLSALSSDYAALVAAAGSGDFSAFAGFPSAFSTALGSGGGSCTSGTEMVYTMSSPGGPWANNQKACIDASATSLTIDGKTLTNPVPNPTVAPPFAVYTFADGDYSYEVVLNDGALHEINVLGANFLGQFTPVSSTGTGNLTVDVTVSGIASASISVPGVPVPSGQDEFCAGVTSDETFNSISSQAGGTLTITSCSFANNTGVIEATLTMSGFSVPYVVTYHYN